MRTLLLIPCSNRKRSGGVENLKWSSEQSVVVCLPDEYGQQLMNLRRTISSRYGLLAGRDLGGQNDVGRLLPACERYDGNLYRKIEGALWDDLAKSDKARVLIVSALYGLITPDEAIRKYNVTMGDEYRPRQRVARWWVNNGLGECLSEYVRENDITVVHNFLGGAYSTISASLRSIRPRIRMLAHSYSGLGFGADHHRGRDVSRLLGKLFE